MHLKCCPKWSNSGWTQQNVPCETWRWKVDIQSFRWPARAGNIVVQSVMLPCCMPSWQNVRSSLCTRFRIIPRQAFRSRPLEPDPSTSNKFSKLSTLPQGLLGKLVWMRPRIKATDPDLMRSLTLPKLFTRTWATNSGLRQTQGFQITCQRPPRAQESTARRSWSIIATRDGHRLFDPLV